MPASIIGNPAVVTGLYQAFNGKAAGYNTYTNNLAFAAQNGPAAYAAEIGKGFYTVPAATLADSVLKNVGIDNAVLEDALVQIFTAYPVQARGQIVLNLINLLSNLEADATYGAAAVAWNKTVASNNAYSNNPTNLADQVIDTSVQTLTSGADVLAGNIFNAARSYTPGGTDQVNTLNDDDVLTGTGTNPTVNFTFVDDVDLGAGNAITPTLKGIETLNISVQGNVAKIIDLQDTTGLDAINVSRVNTSVAGLDFTARNIASATSKLSINNSNGANADIFFGYLASALAGNADSTTLTLNNANVWLVGVEEWATNPTQGFETINLVSTGAGNSVVQLRAEDLQTLNISGTQDLRIGGRDATMGAQGQEAVRYADGLANVNGSLTKIDASAFEGKLDLTLGGEFNAGLDNTSGVAVQLSVTGGKGDDTIRLVDAVVGGAANNTDRINGGEGNNTLVVVGNTTITAAGTAAAPVANVTNIQALEVRSGHDAGVAADTVNINADAFDKLASIYVRNEGQDLVGGVWTSSGEGMTVNLTNLTSAQANAITLAHGTTGNSTIANNVLNIGLKTATGAADTAQVTIVDGVNNNPVFNANISAAAVERVTLVDSDTESNTVHLNQGVGALAPVAGQFAQTGSSITLKGGATGQYLNLDSFSAAVVAAVADTAGNDYAAQAGYGYTTDGSAQSNTTLLNRESAQLVAAGGANAAIRDAAASSVFYGTAGVAGDGVTRHAVENVDASAYLGDVVIRVGDVTRADGVSSMNIKTGVGNDTIIFDALGLTSAGFTSGDTIDAGAGTDTLVLDGNTATIPGTPRVDHQTSEWDNLKGIDVLRFANNAGVANVGNAARVANAGGAYYAHIDNDFVSQTDAGNRLTVVNNDGDLVNNTESDLVLDLRGLSQSKWVTFVGANGVGNPGISSNRIVVDDISANQNQILDGGDTNVRTTAAGGNTGNNNVYEVRNTANVSINDLSQVRNFGLINFTNDQAVPQTLTLTLNNTVVENLVDTSNTAVSAATQEVLNITATDNGAVASALNIDARQVTGFHSLNVTGSAGGNDVLTLNSNVGGSVNYLNLGASAGDRVNWTGGSAATTVTIDMGNTNVAAVGGVVGTAAGNGFAQFVDGAVTTTHDVNDAEIVDLTGLTYLSSVINGTAVAETIIGGAGNDVITGGAGADNMTGGTGADTFTFAVAQSVASTAQVFAGAAVAAGDTITFGNSVDYIADFAVTVDKLNVTTAAAAPTTLIGVATGAALTAGTSYVAYGTWNAVTGTFTVAAGYAAGVAQDAMVVVDGNGQTAITTTGVVILDNLTAALVAGDII